MQPYEPCSLCQGIAFRFVLRRDTPSGAVGVERCRNCGLVRQSHTQAAFNPSLYEYYSSLAGQPQESLYPALNTLRQRELLRQLSTAPGRSLLDVGCGIGQMVRTAAQEGWNARGIDLAEGAISVARSHSIACDLVDFFDNSLDSVRYDVIVMSEFVEHVSCPADFIVRAGALLNSGGLRVWFLP